MLSNLNRFIENIEQAICLIDVKEAQKQSYSYNLHFNSFFKDQFPRVSSTTFFADFKGGIETQLNNFISSAEENAQESFAAGYQGKTYDVKINLIKKHQIALFFKDRESLVTEWVGQSHTVSSNRMTFITPSLDNAPFLTLITNKEGIIEYVNNKFTEINGYGKAEVLGKNVNILKSGIQTADFYKKLWNTINSGHIWSDSFHNKKKSGEFYWQRNQITPLLNEEGEIKRYLCIGEDVTDSKTWETLLEEKSEILHQLMEYIPDTVCIKNKDGRWILANQSYLKYFKKQNEKSVSQGDFIDNKKTQSEKRSYKFSVNEEKAWRDGEIVKSDEILYIENGKEVFLEMLTIPTYHSDKSPNFLIELGRDVTIRKKAIENLKQIEKRYSLAQKASKILSWEWDLESFTLNWAENVEVVFGSANFFDERNFEWILEHIHPDDHFLFFRRILSAFHKHQEYDFDIRIYDIDHNVKWVKQSGLIHRDKINGKLLLIGIVYDITERKNFEKDIIQAKLNAEESDRLKSAFLATMSHELRTPLNAVIGFSDLIMGHNLEGELNEFVELINDNGIQLLTLIEDIFDLSLIESRQVKIHKEKFDIVQVLNELIEIIPTEIQKLNKSGIIEIITEFPDKQIIVNSDTARVTQVISNLVKNAIKFTPSGYVKLGLLENKNDIIIYVEDSGIGISEEKQKIIFEIFRQGEETLTRRFGGAGLGLSLSHNLAALLDGELWVDSEVDKGSTFSFKIQKEKSQIPSIKKEDNSQVDWADKYVLIAEDEWSNVELLSYMLKPSGIRIKVVNNGNDAIKEVLHSELPDLILMDIKMPILNGFEATKTIKKSFPQLPIIAQTAYAIAGDREKAIKIGCDDYITKPIRKKDLLKLMRKYFV